MSILRYSSKEEQILVETAEEKARQEAKYAHVDWDILSLSEKTARALTQVHRMKKR